MSLLYSIGKVCQVTLEIIPRNCLNGSDRPFTIHNRIYFTFNHTERTITFNRVNFCKLFVIGSNCDLNFFFQHCFLLVSPLYSIDRSCQENPPKIKEKRKEILNRRKLLWRNDLGRRRQPRRRKSLRGKDLHQILLLILPPIPKIRIVIDRHKLCHQAGSVGVCPRLGLGRFRWGKRLNIVLFGTGIAACTVPLILETKADFSAVIAISYHINPPKVVLRYDLIIHYRHIASRPLEKKIKKRYPPPFKP